MVAARKVFAVLARSFIAAIVSRMGRIVIGMTILRTR
jgi:hypothetical protein